MGVHFCTCFPWIFFLCKGILRTFGAHGDMQHHDIRAHVLQLLPQLESSCSMSAHSAAHWLILPNWLWKGCMCCNCFLGEGVVAAHALAPTHMHPWHMLCYTLGMVCNCSSDNLKSVK